MCMVSVVTASIPNQWPHYCLTDDKSVLLEIQKVLQKLDEIDKKLGAKECPEDPAKEPTLRELGDRIKKLEALAVAPKLVGPM